MTLQCFEELHDALLIDGAVVQTKAEPRPMQAGNGRNAIPVEAELHDRAFALGAQVRTRVGRCDSPASSTKSISLASRRAFLSLGNVRCFQCSIAASSRSRARRSGRWLQNPICPSKRQTRTSLNCTPNSRSMNKRTRLSVHSAVPKPCAIVFSRCSNSTTSSTAAPGSVLRSAPRPAARVIGWRLR